MNHRVGLAIACVLAGACKGKSKDEPAPKVVEPAPVDAAPAAPPPPPGVGHARLINLYVGAAGEHLKVDVRAGDAVLARGIDYGTASDWFAPPEHTPVTVVGPDGAELGTILHTTATQYETATLTWIRQTGAAAVAVFWDAGDASAPAPPPAGKGVVMLRADALWEHEPDLTPTTGGVAFFVGDGTGCLHQRVEDQGFAAASLGGTNPVIVDLPPGPHHLTLHRWPGKPCQTPIAFELDVDVVAGKGVLAEIHSPDSKHLAALQVPLGL